jgi:hypothetical protein
MLQRLIEARMGKRGKREFVQILGCWRHSALRTCWPASGRCHLQRNRLWRGQAAGAVADRAPTTPARSHRLSLPAKGKGGDDGSRAPSDRGPRRDQPGV